MWKAFAIATMLAALIYSTSETPKNARVRDYGWYAPSWRSIEDPHELLAIPNVWKQDGANKTRLLYKDYETVHGYAYNARNQGAAPSCVGQATAAAVDFLAATQIATGKRERAPPGGASAAVIYGWSRIQIGEINISKFGGGSHCRWAAAAIQKYGTVPNRNYPSLGVDLSQESAKRCLKYGVRGPPEGFEKIGILHPVIEYIKVETYEDVRDAVFNGCPVIIGSSIGFGERSGAMRDPDGFLNRPSSFFGFRQSKWNHAMVIIAVCDEGRKGCLVLNSWGPRWINGPTRFGSEPEGSFWVSVENIEDIVSQGDSYALHGFIGYPNYKLWSGK